jgi:BirA family transcriptional regulator, biotin operon repressor / biotin---[acetyl-CoA-carboxylase] ligase
LASFQFVNIAAKIVKFCYGYFKYRLSEPEFHTFCMKTLFTGQTLIKLDKTESTNDFASSLLANQNVFEGTVVFTHCQTSGKGQRGKAWHSEPGKNLTISVIFKPDFLPVTLQFEFSKAMALAVADFVLVAGMDNVRVKWPNDIYVNDSKIAGILIQNLIKNDKIQYSIVGIGLNINQKAFPEDVPNPTSLALETGEDFKLDYCLERLCEDLEKRYLQLKAGKHVKDEYLERLYRYGEWSKFKSGEEVFRGKIIGISKTGNILIENEEEEVREFGLKEVSFI